MQYKPTKEIPEGLQPSFLSGELNGHLCNGPDQARVTFTYPKELVMRYRVRRDVPVTVTYRYFEVEGSDGDEEERGDGILQSNEVPAPMEQTAQIQR